MAADRSQKPRRGRVSPLAVVWLALALVLGGILFAKRLGAQGGGPAQPKPAVAKLKVGAAGPAAPASAAPAPADSAAPVKDGKDAKGDAKGGKDGKDGKDAKDDYEEPIDYAQVGPEGGVPTHPDGAYRSPFAHPHWGKPANVKVGFLLANLRDYDIQKGTFEADFYVSFTSDRPMPPLNIDFTNGAVDKTNVIADKPTFKMYQYIAKFSSPPDLHDYPFDTQELDIEIEDNDNGLDQMKLIPDQEHTQLDVGFDVPGWDVAFLRARILDHYFPDRFASDDMYYSRYKATLGLRRFTTSAIFTVFVPAIVIVIISVSGLWLPREELEVRSNATTPMLAAAVLFHFALMQQLPATAYLTRADKLMMGVYACLALHMLTMWLWFVFDEKHTERIMQIGKWVGVPVTVGIMAAGILL